MGKYLKFNPKTGEYDIPCTWKENLIATAENTWIPEWKRKWVKEQAENMSEEEARQLCEELDKEIEYAIEMWKSFQ